MKNQIIAIRRKVQQIQQTGDVQVRVRLHEDGVIYLIEEAK